MAGLSVITTPVTGTPISTTTFGIPAANNAGTVLPAPPLAKMTNSGNQNFATTNTPAAITWDTEAFDTVNGHSTSSNTSRYTCQTGYAGYYEVRATLAWTGNATGLRVTWIKVNGTTVDGSAGQLVPASAAIVTCDTSTKVLLAVGDYIEVWGNQLSGGALALTGGGAGNATQSCFEVEWIHS